VRKFLNTLWNTYSFYVTYANLSEGRTSTGSATGAWGDNAPSPASRPTLDRWVLSELNMLVRDVTEAMENYDVLGATRPVADFVDTVSNWYVRLSRRRFWDGDTAALATLHEVLVTVSQLLAPTTPFIAEEIYQNLVVSVDSDAADSVHLSHWPAFDEALIDEQLNFDMGLAQKVTSLGHAARQNANLRVRQPLAQVVARTRSDEEDAGLERMQQLVLDELNVKELIFTHASGDLVDVEVFPYPKQLGQKYGRGYPKIRQAMSGMDQNELAARFQAGESVVIEADGESYEVTDEDVEVRSSPRVGYSVAEDGGYLVAVTTDLTPDLVQEGNARELVRRIQQLRKDADLDISDRIATYVSDEDGAEAGMMHDLLRVHGRYVRQETLSVDLVHVQDGGLPSHLPQDSFELDGKCVTVAVSKK
jgi:isoleucyl-tRNA synthetase